MVETTDRMEAAIATLAERDYPAAGDEYTRAAWTRLADPREGLSPFDADDKGWVGHGLAALAAAGLAYRVAGQDARASRRAVEGVAVARDLKTGLDAPAQRACLEEFVADFRAIGDVGDVLGAYETADDLYREAAPTVEQPQVRATTPLFEAAAEPLKQAARSLDNGEIAVSWDDLHGSDPASEAFLAHRAAFKRQRFPGLIQGVVQAGYLAAPRGTTEYGNETYRCPNCESRDVNWTGSSTLCLRCSTPVVEE
jgi:hypothetical protein